MSENQDKFNGIYDVTVGAKQNSFFKRAAELIAPAVLNHKVTWYGFDGKAQPEGKRNTVTLAGVIGWLDSGISQLINGQAAILAAVKASSEKQGIDPAELERLITEAVTMSAGKYELRKVEDE